MATTLDETRPSTGVELLAMRRIKAAVAKQFPASRDCCTPTLHVAVSDTPANAAITDAYRRLRQRSFIGDQYDWLARFCAERGVEDLQLCIHRDDKAHAVLARLVTKSTAAGLPTYRLTALRWAARRRRACSSGTSRFRSSISPSWRCTGQRGNRA